ncbi:hypothetical protein F-M6_0007 [Faustovirus]|nr:hypothetical protein F-M6_0007 [Faustovirus]
MQDVVTHHIIPKGQLDVWRGVAKWAHRVANAAIVRMRMCNRYTRDDWEFWRDIRWLWTTSGAATNVVTTFIAGMDGELTAIRGLWHIYEKRYEVRLFKYIIGTLLVLPATCGFDRITDIRDHFWHVLFRPIYHTIGYFDHCRLRDIVQVGYRHFRRGMLFTLDIMRHDLEDERYMGKVNYRAMWLIGCEIEHDANNGVLEDTTDMRLVAKTDFEIYKWRIKGTLRAIRSLLWRRVGKCVVKRNVNLN